MPLYTDDPDAMRALLSPASPAWSRAGFGTGAPEPMMPLWRALSAGAAGWSCEVPGDWPGEHARPWMLIHRAPGSQFDALVASAEAGAALPDGLVCVALCGQGFRGQGGRAWEALPGNLHLTLHYRVEASAKALGAGLVMLPAVAAARAVAALSEGRFRPRIKWVNDLMLERRKIAGVLTHTQVMGDRVLGVVFGIGLNVAATPRLAVSPGAGAGVGACEAAALADFDPALAERLGAVLRQVVACADQEMSRLLDEGPATLYALYRASADFLGQTVRLWPTRVEALGETRPIAVGVVRDLLPDLSLRIAGHAEPIRHGRMELLGPADAARHPAADADAEC